MVATANEELPLRIFEKRLLSELGYSLILDREADTGKPIETDNTYRYVLDSGPLDKMATNAGILISGESLLALHHEDIDSAASLREIKRLTRAAISLQLDGKPLKTRQLLIAQQQRKNK